MATYKEPEQISFTTYNKLSDEEKIGKKFIVWGAPTTVNVAKPLSSMKVNTCLEDELSDIKNVTPGDIYIATDTHKTYMSKGKEGFIAITPAISTISNDYVDTCAPITRHRRIYKRKASHCPCCGGALPAMECNDSTELKCPYCDSMIDAVEIIDEEY